MQTCTAAIIGTRANLLSPLPVSLYAAVTTYTQIEQVTFLVYTVASSSQIKLSVLCSKKGLG